jgi:hypothetical protein
VPATKCSINRYCFAWLNLLFRMRTIITPHWRYLRQPLNQ